MKVDLEKLICSFLKGDLTDEQKIRADEMFKKNRFVNAIAVKWNLVNALKEQGIEYKDDKLTQIENEPKFKVGQTIIYKGTENIAPTKMTISDIAKGQYWDDNCCIVPISDQDNWELEKPSTIKFNEPDNKKYKFVGLDNPSTPIPITRMLWKRYSASHRDSIQEHREELLLSLLTKGYQRYQEELRQQQCIASQHKECPLSSSFEHDVKVLQEDLRYILDVNWNPECDYNYSKK